MSRLDFHVTKVQSKMLLGGVLQALAWSLLVYAAVVWVVILVGKLFQLYLPKQMVWLYVGTGVAVVLAIVYAYVKRPTRKHAAVAIDERLGLKERFSTALYARPSSDPFAAAAVRDAESVAERVHLQDKFPVKLPFAGFFTLAVVAVALLTAWLVKPMDLFGRKEEQAKAAEQQRQQVEAKKEVQKAIAKIEAAPLSVQKDEKIKLATMEMKQFLAGQGRDPTNASRTAQAAMEDVKAQMQKIKQMQNVAAALNEMKAWKDLAAKPIDESGPVGKAQSAMAKGEFSKAIDQLKDVVNNFDKMEKPEQDKAAEQMAAMAQQLKDMANNPAAQQEMQKQLQQMGATQQQAQQMQQALQQAANGDKQAAQQLQQMANQVMQQMNQGQGPSQQQIQQAQSMLQKMQMQANGQAQAQQLGQNAANIAKAMQQAAQAAQQQGQQGQQGQPQQAQAGQQGQGKPQAGQGQQQQGNQNAQQQQAQAQMRQQMQQMQAMADAAQQQAGGAGADGQDGGGQGGAEGGGNQQGEMAQAGQAGGGEGGQFELGDPTNRPGGEGAGGGGPAQANGARPKPQPAPFGVKQELSRSDTIDKGKILASNFVKASSFKGESKAELQRVVESLEADATDEVDQARVSRQAREAVKEYNRAILEDQAAAAAAGAEKPAK